MKKFFELKIGDTFMRGSTPHRKFSCFTAKPVHNSGPAVRIDAGTEVKPLNLVEA